MAWAVSIALCLATAPSRADAPDDDTRPTSGDASLLSGRTLGIGRTMLVAQAGFPGVFGRVELAPSSRLNVGVRGGALYASPLMGHATGAGAELAVPVRWHLHGRGELDVALSFEIAAALGEGALFGQRGVFAGELGHAVYATTGPRAGWQLSTRSTLVLGLLGTLAWVSVNAADAVTHWIGNVYATLGFETLISPDLLLFASVDTGAGFAPSAAFGDHLVLRASLGVGFVP